MKSITYGLTSLLGTNKGGILKPDEEGYYDVWLGAFNAFNGSGDYYPVEPVEHLFRPGSSLRRRIDDGTCYIELDHPSPLPGQSKEDWIRRVLRTEQKNVCGHVARVDLEPTKLGDGRRVIGTRGRVAPSGVHGAVLKSSLDNPNENTCFSIRTLTRDSDMPNGRKYKEIIALVGWDRVTEPGMSIAKKHLSPSLEQASIAVDVETLMTIKQIAVEHARDLGTESNDIIESCNEALFELGFKENGLRRTHAMGW